jgi:hypothetical protein
MAQFVGSPTIWNSKSIRVVTLGREKYVRSTMLGWETSIEVEMLERLKYFEVDINGKE